MKDISKLPVSTLWLMCTMNQFTDTFSMSCIICGLWISQRCALSTLDTLTCFPSCIHVLISPYSAFVYTCYAVHSIHSSLDVNWCNILHFYDVGHHTLFYLLFYILHYFPFHCLYIKESTCKIKMGYLKVTCQLKVFSFVMLIK